jgi:hypothetical protein
MHGWSFAKIVSNYKKRHLVKTSGKQMLKPKINDVVLGLNAYKTTDSVNYSSGGYIPGAVRTALFLGLDILLDGRLPLLLVPLVDGVDLPSGLALKIQSFVGFKSVFRIRIQSGQWIRIPDPYPGGQKIEKKLRNFMFLCTGCSLEV